MIAIRARQIALLAMLVVGCAGEGDPTGSALQGNEAFGKSQHAQSAVPISVIACNPLPDDLNFGACSRRGTGSLPDVYPGMFAVTGANGALDVGQRNVNELVYTFKPERQGRPGTISMYLRRTAVYTDPSHRDLLVDLIGLGDRPAESGVLYSIPVPKTGKDPRTDGQPPGFYLGGSQLFYEVNVDGVWLGQQTYTFQQAYYESLQDVANEIKTSLPGLTVDLENVNPFVSPPTAQLRFATGRTGANQGLRIYPSPTTSLELGLNGPSGTTLMQDMGANSVAGTGYPPIPRSDDGCGLGQLDSQVARGRYDTGKLTFNPAAPSDTLAKLNLSAQQRTVIYPDTTYGVYVHVESPGVEQIGIAGMAQETYALGQPYFRQARFSGYGEPTGDPPVIPECMTSPDWTPLSGRDVWFILTVEDGCVSNATAPSCGQGICFRNNVPQCNEYGEFIECAEAYCDKPNDTRCVPGKPEFGPTPEAAEYGCNVARNTCFKRTGVPRACTTNAECVPQVPAGVTVNPAHYVCDTSTFTCTPPADKRECFVANDPICVPSGAGVNPSDYGCDVATNSCYSLIFTPETGAVLTETCNGLDDNCDGATDNNLAPIQCGRGECYGDVQSCQEGRSIACDTYILKRDRAPLTCPATCNPAEPATCPASQCELVTVEMSLNEAAADTPDNLCNGLDENCNGLIDEQVESTTCGEGVCTNTVFPGCTVTLNLPVTVPPTYTSIPKVCIPLDAATPEVCNGIDDNCAGGVDEGDGPNNKMTRFYYPYAANTLNKGTCTGGRQECAGSNGVAAWETYIDPVGPAAVDLCDSQGLDEDCDGFSDNPIPGNPALYTTAVWNQAAADAIIPGAIRNVGICRDGVETCGRLMPDNTVQNPGQPFLLTPPTYPRAGGETCNGLDDDCDGQIDDMGVTTCGVGVCAMVVPSCEYKGEDQPDVPLVCVNADERFNGDTSKARPGGESAVPKNAGDTNGSCDGLDDDCDGYVDNTPGDSQNGTLQRDCFTGPESAKIKDGGGNTIGYKGICKKGEEVCANAYWPTVGKSGVPPNPSLCVGQVLPGTERCNNLDDNCDGVVDGAAANADCAPEPNATGVYCDLGTCKLSGCVQHYYDMDNDPSNGCEFADDTWAFVTGSNPVSNTSETQCVAGKAMGSLAIGGVLSQSGYIPKDTFRDYFTFTIPAGDTSKLVTVQVRQTSGSLPAGGNTANFKFSIYSSACAGNLNYCGALGSNLDTWTFRDNCKDTAGVNNCSTRSTTVPTTVYIRVQRVAGGTLSTAGYTLTATRAP